MFDLRNKNVNKCSKKRTKSHCNLVWRNSSQEKLHCYTQMCLVLHTVLQVAILLLVFLLADCPAQHPDTGRKNMMSYACYKLIFEIVDLLV